MKMNDVVIEIYFKLFKNSHKNMAWIVNSRKLIWIKSNSDTSIFENQIKYYLGEVKIYVLFKLYSSSLTYR